MDREVQRDVEQKPLELEPNSRPYLLKQLIADGFDTVLLFLLFTVLTLVVMKTPLASAYDAHTARAVQIREEAVAAFPDDRSKQAESLSGNEEYRYVLFAANLHAYLLKALAAFVSEAVLLLAVPLLNRNRQTFGKMMTGVMPFNRKRRSRISAAQVFGRFLFVLIADSLFWYLLTGVFTFLLIPVLRLTEMLLNKNRRTLLDLVSGVHMIEKRSYDGIN